jgi:resuscitation-promoting factor RpfB
MDRITQKSSIRYGILLAACCFILISFFSIMSARANAASTTQTKGKRLITIHDGSTERSILTNETTLRRTFKEAQISIDENDLIEPGLDEKLITNHYEVNIYRARPVTIIDGAVQTKVMTAYRTPKQIAKQAGIVLQTEDISSMDASQDVVADGVGLQMKIKRATPITLVLYGKSEQAYTQAKTVGEMIDQKGIKLGQSDVLSVPRNTKVVSNMVIELWRNGKQTISEDQPIQFETEQIKDTEQEVGYKLVKTPGVAGRKTVTYEIDIKNGIEISRTMIQSVVIKQPEKQVEVVGVKLKNTFSGSFGDALARLRSCEAGGVYSRNSGNGYYGAYQYNISTWAGYKGYQIPSDAPPAVQDERAWQTYQARGWQPWPSCSRSQGLQDVYR